MPPANATSLVVDSDHRQVRNGERREWRRSAWFIPLYFLFPIMHEPDHQRISKGIVSPSAAVKTFQDTLKAIEPSHIRIKNTSIRDATKKSPIEAGEEPGSDTHEGMLEVTASIMGCAPYEFFPGDIQYAGSVSIRKATHSEWPQSRGEPLESFPPPIPVRRNLLRP